jgi:hypothetical protein
VDLKSKMHKESAESFVPSAEKKSKIHPPVGGPKPKARLTDGFLLSIANLFSRAGAEYLMQITECKLQKSRCVPSRTSNTLKVIHFNLFIFH